MVEMIHAVTGSIMTVADERVEEYKAAGHRLAVAIPTEQKPKTEPKKAATKKATTKKK